MNLNLAKRSSIAKRALQAASYSSAASTRTSPYASNSDKLKTKYDVVIVGAGHNGLVAANYLAKFSNKKDMKICVLESRDVLGGAAVTEEIFPGFKFSRASYLLSLFRPIILQDLDLMRHGMLKFHTRNPSSYTPLLETDPQYSQNSKSLTLSADSEFNIKEISKFSIRDAQKYEKYEDWLNSICSVLEKFMDKPPPSQSVLKSKRSIISKINYLRSFCDLGTAKFLAYNYEDIYRLFTEPASNILNEWFESNVLKATLATDSVIGAMLAPSSAGSAYVLLHHIIGGIDGKKGIWAYVEGGMGSISNCLAKNAKCFENESIEIYLSQEVSEIVVNNIKSDSPSTNGVLLKSGKFIEAQYVLSNCTPHVTFKNLMGKYKLSDHKNESIANYFKRVNNIDYESGTMKINLAVSKLPNFKADPTLEESVPMPHHRCTIHINCENVQMIEDAFKEAKLEKKGSTRPMIEMVIPSSLDPTLAPKGSHVILLFCQYFPIDRNTNSVTKETYAQRVFDAIEAYAPGFKSSIIGQDILTPYDLEQTFGLTGGNIFHGAMPLNQLFISRPAMGWSTYTTPVKNLYLAGSGAHPGGGVMGSAGRLAALECLSSLNKSPK